MPDSSVVPDLKVVEGLALGDIDGDFDRDLVNSQNTKYVNDGTGVFTAMPLVGSSGTGGGGVCAVVDVDADGLADLAGIDRWNRQQRDGSFESHVYSPDHSGGFSVATGDLDGDGDVDVVSSIGGYSQIWWFENPLLTTSQATILAWRQRHFGSPDDAGLGADGQDPDGDGVVNLLEYAFGMDPHDAAGTNGAQGIPSVQRNAGGEYSFTFALPVPTAHDLTLSVQFKGNLIFSERPTVGPRLELAPATVPGSERSARSSGSLSMLAPLWTAAKNFPFPLEFSKATRCGGSTSSAPPEPEFQRSGGQSNPSPSFQFFCLQFFCLVGRLALSSTLRRG